MPRLFRISYNSVVPVTETVSPSTGKPYKRPKKWRRHIHLSELVEAENLMDALIQGEERAKLQKWRLQEVSERRHGVIA